MELLRLGGIEFIVTTDVDINDDSAWQALLELQLRAEQLNFTVTPISSWISAFEAHFAVNRKPSMMSASRSTLSLHGMALTVGCSQHLQCPPVDLPVFSSGLRRAKGRATRQTSYLSTISLLTAASNVRLESFRSVLSASFHTLPAGLTSGIPSTDEQVVAMDQARAVYDGLALEGYAFTWSHLWLERYRSIADLTIQTIASAFGAILVLTFLFLHPREAVTVAFLVGMSAACTLECDS